MMRKAGHKVVNYPLVDYLLAALCVVIVLAGSWLLKGFSLPVELDGFTRRSIYQTLATLSGTLLGLILTAISVLHNVLRSETPQLDWVLGDERKKAAVAVFFAAMRALALTFLVFMAALIVDSAEEPADTLMPVQLIAVAGVGLAFFRVARIVWVLNKLLVGAATSGGRSQFKEGPFGAEHLEAIASEDPSDQSP